MKFSIRDLMQNHLLPATCCLLLAIVTGCGPKVVKDPLVGVGGYKLLYKQQEQRRVEPDLIASSLRERINAKNQDEVVVNALDDGGCEILLPRASEKTVADVKQAIALSNLLKFRIVARQRPDKQLIAAADKGQDTSSAVWVVYSPETVSLPEDAAVRTTPEGKSMVLILEGDEPVDAWHVKHVEVAKDESLRPCLHGTMNDEGTRRLERLTWTYRFRQLATISTVS